MKLTYFNLRARAEIARLILAHAGEDYEDKRIEKNDWPALKSSTPAGQLPVLEVDGIQICQSMAIARFLANKFGLAGTTPLEKAQADMVVDCVQDFFTAIVKVHFEKNEEVKKELGEKMKTETAPAFLKTMTAILTKNGGHYMVGKGVTWADIALAWILETMAQRDKEFSTKCPPLAEFLNRVNNLPGIKAWIEKRPKTDM